MNVRTEIVFGMASDGCTAVFLKTDTSSLLAQNWDWQEEQKENLINLNISQGASQLLAWLRKLGLLERLA